MCYNSNVSIKSFIIGLIGIFGLLFFGSNKYNTENKKLLLFFLFVVFIQFIDYLLWIDIDCKKGYNKLGGILGGLFIGIQPFLFYYCFVDNKNIYTNILAILYIFYLFFIYIISFNNLCSNRVDNRPRWSWMENYNRFGFRYIYTVIIICSILLISSKLKFIVALLYGLTFIISYFNYNNLLAEFWCYFSNSVPLMILFLQKFIL
jgi:hypothetical protein